MANVLVNAPKTARRGQAVEIKALILHPMETGFRPGAVWAVARADAQHDWTLTTDLQAGVAGDSGQHSWADLVTVVCLLPSSSRLR